MFNLHYFLHFDLVEVLVFFMPFFRRIVKSRGFNFSKNNFLVFKSLYCANAFIEI